MQLWEAGYNTVQHRQAPGSNAGTSCGMYRFCLSSTWVSFLGNVANALQLRRRKKKWLLQLLLAYQLCNIYTWTPAPLRAAVTVAEASSSVLAFFTVLNASRTSPSSQSSKSSTPIPHSSPAPTYWKRRNQQTKSSFSSNNECEWKMITNNDGTNWHGFICVCVCVFGGVM